MSEAGVGVDWLERERARREREGWKVVRRRDQNVAMRHHSFGELRTHVLLAVLVGWWTLSIANLVYAAYSYFSSGEYVLLDGEEESNREGWGLCRRCVTPVDGSASACEACGYDPAATLRRRAWQSLLFGFLLLVFMPIVALVLLASGAIAGVLYLAGPSPAD